MDEVICEGFLTKSPPERKINRARWHQRWFVLRRLQGAYLLQYFKDRNSVNPKGTIDLNYCEQVDQGLTFETKKFHDKAFIFDIVTPKRKYFLVARSEEDMIRWVRSICEVCGFHLDGAEQNEEDVVQTQPMTIHHPQQDHSNVYSDEPTLSAPIHPNGNNFEDGYFELSDAVTGDVITSTNGGHNLAKSLPISSISGRDSGVATSDEPLDRQSFDSSGSSLPSDSAPPPPPKSTVSKTADRTSPVEETNDIYDTPPVHQRHSFANDSGAIYDCPPALTRRPSKPINESEELYKQVPAPRPSVTSSSLDFPLSPLNNGSVFEQEMASDIYDVPPVSRELPSPRQSVYDTPPVNFQKNEEMSQSTDNLAKTFQNISFRNSMGTNSNASENFDLYDIPSSPTSVNDSNASFNDQGPISPPMDMAPPRPPKPTHKHALDPTTPPPSFDDTYNVPLNFLENQQMNATDLQNRLSQEVQGQIGDTPPSWNHSGHTWMDNKVKPRYINTKRTEAQSASGMPVNRMRASLDGQIPAPDPNSYVNVRNERYVFSPQSCYLPMQGNSSSSSNNTFEFSEEPYMAMEGAIDGTADSYTFMQSPSAASDIPPPIGPRSLSVSSRNSQGELPPPVPRSLSTSSRNSLGEVPPPINRYSKPDRRSTSTLSSSSLSRSPDLAAVTGAGSFYATPDDALEIVASPRTQSFSKRGMIPPPKPESLLQDSFRRRTNTGGSSTSSSGESGIGQAQEAHYVTPTDGLRQPTMTDEVYVYKDPPPLTPKLEKAQAAALQAQSAAQAPKDPPTFEAIASANIPPPAAEDVAADKIEYLELDHAKNEESAPPRPPKPISSTTVEYFDLDAQKTKALQDVTAERQKESYNKAT